MRWNAFIYLTVAGILVSVPASASVDNVVEARLPGGKTVSASYLTGKKDKPALLVLHGFLQTRHFPTVVGVTEAVSPAGYASLAPSLSLGISGRAKSLPCEAVHTHSLQDDADEVAFWVRWLEKKAMRASFWWGTATAICNCSLISNEIHPPRSGRF